MSEAAPEGVQLPRDTKGKRPHFFDDPSSDQLMTFVLELMTEISVLRDRIDTVERLLAANKCIDPGEIDSYTPDAETDSARAHWRQAFIERVLRMHPPE